MDAIKSEEGREGHLSANNDDVQTIRCGARRKINGKERLVDDHDGAQGVQGYCAFYSTGEKTIWLGVSKPPYEYDGAYNNGAHTMIQ